MSNVPAFVVDISDAPEAVDASFWLTVLYNFISNLELASKVKYGVIVAIGVALTFKIPSLFHVGVAELFIVAAVEVCWKESKRSVVLLDETFVNLPVAVAHNKQLPSSFTAVEL